jgi:hypothetical protein
MPRTLAILFRKDPVYDRERDGIDFQGYRMLWPDGQPVAVGLDALCRHGRRLLGLDRLCAGGQERLVEMLCFPVPSSGERITRLPGHRVRRFFVERHGARGRLHFMDGTATEMVFEIGRDETTVLDWIGLTAMADGTRQWIDVAAHPLDKQAESAAAGVSS